MAEIGRHRAKQNENSVSLKPCFPLCQDNLPHRYPRPERHLVQGETDPASYLSVNIIFKIYSVICIRMVTKHPKHAVPRCRFFNIFKYLRILLFIFILSLCSWLVKEYDFFLFWYRKIFLTGYVKFCPNQLNLGR